MDSGTRSRLHHDFAASTGANCYSLGDADTTRVCGSVKSKKMFFEKSPKGSRKSRVSFGPSAEFSIHSRATLRTARCAKPVDAIFVAQISNVLVRSGRPLRLAFGISKIRRSTLDVRRSTLLPAVLTSPG
jgi:hypothetical protein